MEECLREGRIASPPQTALTGNKDLNRTAEFRSVLTRLSGREKERESIAGAG